MPLKIKARHIQFMVNIWILTRKKMWIDCFYEPQEYEGKEYDILELFQINENILI